MPHLAPRQADVEFLYRIQLQNPKKHTPKVIFNAWAYLTSLWADDLEARENRLFLIRKVGRATFAELKETGLSPGRQCLITFRFPDTFDPNSPAGYYQTHVLGALGGGGWISSGIVGDHIAKTPHLLQVATQATWTLLAQS